MGIKCERGHTEGAAGAPMFSVKAHPVTCSPSPAKVRTVLCRVGVNAAAELNRLNLGVWLEARA
jgi:hypothetical protein